MSETTTYQPAPGITVRQRISVKQTAKGEFSRDYTVEITGRMVCVEREAMTVDGPQHADLLIEGENPHDSAWLSTINDSALRRAEADYQAHIARIREVGHA